jgi:hypothetical protein
LQSGLFGSVHGVGENWSWRLHVAVELALVDSLQPANASHVFFGAANRIAAPYEGAKEAHEMRLQRHPREFSTVRHVQLPAKHQLNWVNPECPPKNFSEQPGRNKDNKRNLNHP